MSFEWSDFFDFALSLYENKDFQTEAPLRSAVSRFYYASFGSAREYAEKNLKYKSNSEPGKDHYWLIKHYHNNNRHQIADKLEHMRGWRVECDYHKETGDLNLLLSKSLAFSKYIISKTACSSRRNQT